MNNRIQEWFEQMVRGMAAQQWMRAMSQQGQCVYRAGASPVFKCAIGHIIPDNASCISTNLTATSLWSADRISDLGLGEVTQEEYNFLIQAQGAHDDHNSPQVVKLNFIRVGEQNHLTWPVDVPQ